MSESMRNVDRFQRREPNATRSRLAATSRDYRNSLTAALTCERLIRLTSDHAGRVARFHYER